MQNLKSVVSEAPPTSSLSDAERLARVRLIRSENVGPVTFYQLLKYYGSAMTALEAIPELAARGGKRRPLKVAPLQEVEAELKSHQKYGSSLIVYGDADYPQLLKTFADAPPIFSIKGNRSLLHTKAVSIVGARNASLNGRFFTKKMAEELGAHGYVIISGLAHGIDTAAHEGGLSTGTIAVIAGGINDIYPAENAKLYEKIATDGLLVAESPFGIVAQASFFPRRNRVVSGLSLGTLVVEATQKSGSLITARFALEQNREVFAVPGSPLDPRCRGANQLIKEGAVLVQSVQDILEPLERPLLRKLNSMNDPYPQLFEQNQALSEEELAIARQHILSYLSLTPISVDELQRECQFSRMSLMLCLIELELAGKIVRLPGNQICLSPGEMSFFVIPAKAGIHD